MVLYKSYKKRAYPFITNLSPKGHNNYLECRNC